MLHFPKEVKLDQKTDDWLRWRNFGIGSSDAGILMGYQRYKTVEELWSEKCGFTKPVFQMSPDIQRGVDNEDNAVYLYNYQTGFNMIPLTFEHPLFPFMKASMDGIDVKYSRLIEVKCPRPWRHEKSKKFNFVSPEYVSQIQHQYMVLGALGQNGNDFISYLVPEEENIWGDIHYFPVPRMDWFIDILFQRECYFWNCVQLKQRPNPFYFQEIFQLNTYFNLT